MPVASQVARKNTSSVGKIAPSSQPATQSSWRAIPAQRSTEAAHDGVKTVSYMSDSTDRPAARIALLVGVAVHGLLIYHRRRRRVDKWCQGRRRLITKAEPFLDIRVDQRTGACRCRSVRLVPRRC